MSTRPLLVAIVGPTATGKSALGIALARRFDGEVVACDSTAVYRGFDIGTDKVSPAEQAGVPHHMVDVADPTDEYSAARYGREASAVIRDITARGRLPILVGGTGLYYRALTRGFFPGPSRDVALRARLERIADRRGVERLHALLARVDPAIGRAHPAARSQAARPCPRGVAPDRSSPHRALCRHRVADPRLRRDELRAAGFPTRTPPLGSPRASTPSSRGVCSTRCAALLAAGVPETAHPFTGLVYRQALEHLHGVRDEAATRELIVRENRKYARRQLIWFRKEPNLQWIHAAGERDTTRDEVVHALAARENQRNAPNS